MNIAQTRQAIAAAADAALPDVKIHPYRPRGSRHLHGWVEMQEASLVAVTLTEVALRVNVVIPLGDDQGDFERMFDLTAGPLVDRLGEYDTGVTATPQTDSINGGKVFCLVATFSTECEVA